MKKITSLFLSVCILITGIVGVIYAEEIKPCAPVFSCEGGIYNKEFSLSLDGGGNTVYYTLDGSMPGKDSYIYTQPIDIKSVKESPRSVQGRVAQQRMDKGVVVRACSIDAMGAASDVVTNTYFVSEQIAEIGKNVPIVALSASPYDLWDYREGIYTNYNYEHNILGYVEYFDNDGDGFERSIEMKVSGHGSRSNPKKSIRLYFTKGDTEGRKNLEYNIVKGADKNFYNNDPVKKHGKITFRISDWTDTDLKDPFIQRITEYMRPDSAASNPAALFLNGEFWGIYEAREQYDNRYLDYHYEAIGKDDIVFLDRDWTTENSKYVLSDNGYEGIDRVLYEEGPKEDEGYYSDQFNYVKYLMLNSADDKVYNELTAMVDIDNLIDYLFVYLYADNIDWPGNNFKFWRTTIERSTGDVYAADGKWRFMVHDFDLAFDGINNNTMEYVLKSQLPETEPRHPNFAGEVLEGLFRNEEFRNRFAQRSMAYLSSAVSEENVSEVISRMINEREAVKGYDLLRWDNMIGSSSERLYAWKYSVVNKFVGFAHNRNPYYEKMISDFYEKYYQSKIGESVPVNFEIDAEKASADIAGAVMRKSFYGDKANSFTVKLYENIETRIGAECKDGFYVKSVTVESDGDVIRYDGCNAAIMPKAGMKVKFEIVPGYEKEDETASFDVLREGRFALMKVGEKLPVEIKVLKKSGESEKGYGFECVCDTDIVSIGDNNIITAKKSGSGSIVIKYKGLTKQVKIVVNE